MRSPRSGRQLHPTQVTLAQDYNATEDVRERSESNWRMTLGGMKKFAEV